MSYILFHRESENFKDILNDNVVKKTIRTKMQFHSYLILELKSDKDQAYAILKYGDDVISMNNIVKDRTPIMDKDYAPDRNHRYWKKRLEK